MLDVGGDFECTYQVTRSNRILRGGETLEDEALVHSNGRKGKRKRGKKTILLSFICKHLNCQLNYQSSSCTFTVKLQMLVMPRG